MATPSFSGPEPSQTAAYLGAEGNHGPAKMEPSPDSTTLAKCALRGSFDETDGPLLFAAKQIARVGHGHTSEDGLDTL